mmetsp:Transcript_11202/g.17141  ORF Transcript_11202/g.17141 Transcript_11202/m.17141 type:complete len:132 (+) Transcript_11202:706-1101(+)
MLVSREEHNTIKKKKDNSSTMNAFSPPNSNKSKNNNRIELSMRLTDAPPREMRKQPYGLVLAEHNNDNINTTTTTTTTHGRGLQEKNATTHSMLMREASLALQELERLRDEMDMISVQNAIVLDELTVAGP